VAIQAKTIPIATRQSASPSPDADASNPESCAAKLRYRGRMNEPVPFRWLLPGYAFIVLSIGHMIYGICAWQFQQSWLLDVHQQHEVQHATMMWFLVAAPLMAMLGSVMLWGVTEARQPLPRSVGITVGIIALVGAWIWPLSGFLVGILLGLFMTFVR
jgi:hypothetical protein